MSEPFKGVNYLPWGRTDHTGVCMEGAEDDRLCAWSSPPLNAVPRCSHHWHFVRMFNSLPWDGRTSLLGAAPEGALDVSPPVDHSGQRTVLLLIREITLKYPQGVGWQSSFLTQGCYKYPLHSPLSKQYLMPDFFWLPGAPGRYQSSNKFSGM